jgi:hypothetical protein
MSNAVIAGYARTPFHFARKGKVTSVRPHDLTAIVLRGLVAGAVEAGLTVLAIRDQVAPPTPNLDIRDADNTLNVVADRALPMPMTHAMTNSFGFGGTNACLIFSAAASGR